MRTAFLETLLELAKGDPRITLIVGDLGFGVVEPLVRERPAQFVNAGVAEQNMTGLAAGMALSGKIPLTYSIANFPTLRCLEQIRNDVCYHNANVKIVAVGGGLVYGALGTTHHGTEDLAVMRALPNMTVVAPNDPVEVKCATRAIVEHEGPCYLRLGRSGEARVHTQESVFTLGKAVCIRQGADITLVATGGLLGPAVRAAELLQQHGIQSRVLSMHTVKPLDEEAVIQAARETHAIFTLEEHGVIGGLGGAVAEALLEAGAVPRKFRRFGIRNGFLLQAGDQLYLRAQCGLDEWSIAREIASILTEGTQGGSHSPWLSLDSEGTHGRRTDDLEGAVHRLPAAVSEAAG